MENENTAKTIEKYDNYTFLEFAVKPSLFEEYIRALKEFKQYELIDSIFENYLEIIIKAYSKFQNPYVGFSIELCQKSKKISKLFHLITIVILILKKLLILLRKACL